MSVRRVTVMFLVGLILVNIVIGGCSNPAKKPIEPGRTSMSPKNPSPDPVAKAPLIVVSPLELAHQAVDDAVKVDGVRQAYAFVADKILYIGLDLYENVDKMQSSSLERQVKSRMDTLRSGYVVRVSSNQDIVRLIKTVYEGLDEGQSFSNFNSEIHRVVLVMTPKGSRLFNLPVKFSYILGANRFLFR